MQAWQTAVAGWLVAEMPRAILFLPVALAAGILLYFALPEEPPLRLGLEALLLAATGAPYFRQPWLRWACMVTCLVALGFVATQWQARRNDQPLLAQPLYGLTFQARLLEVSQGGSGMRLLLADPQPIPPGDLALPRRVRLNLREAQSELHPGQLLRLKGGLMPLPEPSSPRGFDFGRYFYFQGIGALGFATAPAEILSPAAPSAAAAQLAEWRQRITRYFLALGGDEGAIAAALVTGDQGHISPPVVAAMRGAGLTHILAISGMNLALAAGLVLAILRALIALVPPLALRFDARKIAALGAILSSTAYLAISGYPVSAQRAYVMILLVLGAMLLDRQVMPLRSLMLAATLILLWQPESLLSPGFQLSFAATLALVSMVEEGMRLGAVASLQGSLAGRLLLYAGGVLATCLAAGLATAPFSLFHFQQLSLYQVAANLLAGPLVSLLIMPALVVGILLVPFKLSAAPFAVMLLGIRWLEELSGAVARWPEALQQGIAMPVGGILLFATGLLLFCLLQTPLRRSGLLLMLLSLLSLAAVQKPILLVSAQARQVAAQTPDGWQMLRGGTDNFTARSWRQAFGIPHFAAAPCRKPLCRFSLAGRTAAYLSEPSEQACPAEILIAPFMLHCPGHVAVGRPLAASWLLDDFTREAARPWLHRWTRRSDGAAPAPE